MTASTFPDSGPLYSEQSRRRYNLFLQMVAGLGGLLYGIDVGIIGGALPYLEATSKLGPSELSIIVAAVLLGGVFSTLFAGLLADWMGRKPLMILSGTAFILSIPVIALSQGYSSLFFGRLLQGMSGGLIGIVVPLYLAECLSASTRGKGTGVFQWMLTFGIVAAALIGIYFSYRVAAVARTSDPASLFGSRIMHGAAFSGFRCLRVFSLCSAHSWLRSRRDGFIAEISRKRPMRRFFDPGPLNRQPLSCRRWRLPQSLRLLAVVMFAIRCFAAST